MTPLEQLETVLARLPGIGRRSAERLAAHLVRRPDGISRDLSAALSVVQEQLTACPLCGSVTEKTQSPCRLCVDPHREEAILCIVEDPADIPLIERSGEYRGRYFSLMGKLSPMRGEGLADLRLSTLWRRLEKSPVREILLALNSDVESEATASYLHHILHKNAPHIRVSRLALGIPAGSAIAFSDPVTLARAIRGRTEA